MTDQSDEIMRLWNAGCTAKAIRQKLDLSYYRVSTTLRENDVDTMSRTGTWTPEQDRLLIAAREAGLTGSDLYAAVPGKSKASVVNRLSILRRERRVR